MIAPAHPRRTTTEPVVTFQVDDQAEPGDVVPALARLLIDIDRRRQAQAKQQAQEAQRQQHDGRGKGEDTGHA